MSLGITLVTGHLGYIGQHLTQKLSGVLTCDLKNGLDFEDIRGQEFDTVIHLAAVASVMAAMRDPEACFNNNVFKIVSFLKNNRVGRLIFASTGGAIYGNKHFACEQDASWVGCISPYGQSKYLAEQLIRVLHPNHVILRFANVVGGNSHVRSEILAHEHFRVDNPIVVYGDSIRDFVSIDVVCEAIIRSMKSDITGTFNIGSGVETHVRDVAERFAENRKVPIVYEPPRKGEIDIISLNPGKAQAAGLL